MPSLTPEIWAQIRADYEHSEVPIYEICLAHGISATTLRDRMRRWHWTRRRPPVPREGPPAVPRIEEPPASQPDAEAPNAWHLGPRFREDEREQPAELVADASAAATSDPAAVAERLHGAVARVLPAIEATVARLASGPQHPREMEQTARALGTLMRTLRELNGLTGRPPTPAAEDEPPRNMDALRSELARRINALLDTQRARRMEEMPKRVEAAWLGLDDDAGGAS